MFAMQPSRVFQCWERRVCASITFAWVCSSKFIAEFRGDIRITIPVIAGQLNSNYSEFRKMATELLSRLAAQGMCKDHLSVGVLKHVCS